MLYQELGELLGDSAEPILPVPSLLEFTQRTFPNFRASRFHVALCDRLQRFLADVEARKSPRLLITVPPRHGKSEISSVRFPAYVLGKHPDWPIIHTSYTSDLSNDFSRQVRALLREDDYQAMFPGILPAKDSRSVERWGIEGRRGAFISTGMGGTITGRGAKCIIVDDPVKNETAADSEIVRKQQRDWFGSTLYTRLEDGGGILLIMTRWHTDDLGGYVTTGAGTDEPPPEHWDVLKLPALAKQDDPLGREPGEPLWAEKYDREALERIKAVVRSRWWGALYDQEPVAEEGNLLEVGKIRHAEIYPNSPERKMLTVYQGWDLAISERTTADYTVCATIGIDVDNNIYILDIFRERVGFNATMGETNEQAAVWKPVSIGIEATAYQAAAFEEASRRYLRPFRKVTPSKDKVTRSKLLEDRISMGKVYANKAAKWWPEFKAEGLAFPTGANDDQIDAVVNALSLAPAATEEMSEKVRAPEWSPEWAREMDEALEEMEARGRVGYR